MNKQTKSAFVFSNLLAKTSRLWVAAARLKLEARTLLYLKMDEFDIIWSGTSLTLLEFLYNSLVFSMDPPGQISKQDLFATYNTTPLSHFLPQSALPSNPVLKPTKPPAKSMCRNILTYALVSSKQASAIIGIIALVLFLVATDVYSKIEYLRVVNSVKTEQCRQDYVLNKCDHATRSAAVVNYCIERELCISQDPNSSILTLHLGAELLSTILQSLVAPLDYKTIVVVLSVYLG